MKIKSPICIGFLLKYNVEFRANALCTGSFLNATKSRKVTTILKYSYNNSQRFYSADKNFNNSSFSSQSKARNIGKIDQKHLLLAKTTNPVARNLIHLRWALKKSTRPFNTDDIGAFISWILVSNVLLIILGTTTFASLIIYFMNTVFAQEYVATKIGNIITRNSSLSVVFEKAIFPDWSSGKICFKNVFISRRPKLPGGFAKGSQQEAVERAKLALSEQLLVRRGDFDDGNYTQFDITLDQVKISLSFTKWFKGGGILDEVTINGLRGVVDRTHVVWKEDEDPKTYSNVHKPGDFEISTFRMNDVLFTLYQPDGFRPFQVSIFNCELPQLRKHWLFYDILDAATISGTYDNSMFTIDRMFKKLDNAEGPNWRKYTRMRIDHLNIDHLNAGVEGAFGWIKTGKVDMIADIFLPENDLTASDIPEIISSIRDKLLKEKFSHFSAPPIKLDQKLKFNPYEYLIVDFFLRFHKVRAEVPLFAPELSYVNNALIRPIVGYINSTRSYIPIRCRVVKKLNDFEGSWTIYDSLLMDDLSAGVYDAFVNYVADNERKNLRLRRVGFWSLQVIIQLILMGLGTIT